MKSTNGRNGKNGHSGVNQTLVLIDIPSRVAELKPLLKEQGYKVLAVAVTENGLQAELANQQEEDRESFKAALKDKGAKAVEGHSAGVRYKARITNINDIPECWDALREESERLPKGGEIKAIIVGSHLTLNDSGQKTVDELLAFTRPSHLFPKAKLWVNFNGIGDNNKPPASMFAEVAKYRNADKLVGLLPCRLDDVDHKALNPEALGAVRKAIENPGSVLPNF
ncbi:MAG: hypothetical protein ACOYJ2_00395 [Rickettsiales bacterium]